MINSITLSANAKLNLSLEMVGKRDDGYHNISSVMQEIDLADEVTVTLVPRFGIQLECYNPQIPTNIRNIAFRAARTFLEEAALYVGVKIVIRKKIPLMGGLGGSSTDGAAVLRALNHLQEDFCGQVYDDKTLRGMAANLGADVPFALVGGRALCEGKGDIITPMPNLPPQFYVVVQPDFYLSTRLAYELYDSKSAQGNLVRKSVNVFQDLYDDPRIYAICDALTALGAVSACMTGSGSAVYGVFGSEDTARAVAEEMNALHPFAYLARNGMKN
jgi:4-diphosphocytidyl-2-C-methyl-D-erythritol kinase